MILAPVRFIRERVKVFFFGLGQLLPALGFPVFNADVGEGKQGPRTFEVLLCFGTSLILALARKLAALQHLDY